MRCCSGPGSCADNVRGYEALYVALAERLGATLVTADARLACATGPRCEMVLVGPRPAPDAAGRWEGTGAIEDARSGAVATQLRARLSADLRTTMRARDHAATAAIRSMVGALDNAEAVHAPERSSIDPPLVGHGAGEAPRRMLDAATVRGLLDREIIERDDAAREYRRLGQDDAAERLGAEAAVLRRYVDTWP